MGVQLVCDKCGKVKPKGEPEFEIYITEKRGSAYGYDKNKYLCRVCYEKFKKFIGLK